MGIVYTSTSAPEQLREYLGQTIEVTAVIQTRSRVHSKLRSKLGNMRMLLREVWLVPERPGLDDDIFLTDHTWIQPTRVLSGLPARTRLKFRADVVEYEKRGGETGYGLDRIRNVRYNPEERAPVRKRKPQPPSAPKAGRR